MIKYSLWTFNCSISPLSDWLQVLWDNAQLSGERVEVSGEKIKKNILTDRFYIYKLFIYHNSSNWWYWGSLMYRCWPIMINNTKQMLICVIVVENLLTFWSFDLLIFCSAQSCPWWGMWYEGNLTSGEECFKATFWIAFYAYWKWLQATF